MRFKHFLILGTFFIAQLEGFVKLEAFKDIFDCGWLGYHD